jgi:hypothetical protein
MTRGPKSALCALVCGHKQVLDLASSLTDVSHYTVQVDGTQQIATWKTPVTPCIYDLSP